MRVRGYPDLLVNNVLAEVQFTDRKSALAGNNNNAQEDIAFCHTIQSIRAKPKEHLNEQMVFNRKSTFAERNLSGSTNYILQERKIKYTTSELTVFLELRLRKTVRSSEQIMSADKYPSIFFCQMGTIVFIILEMFFATRIWVISPDIPQYSVT